MVALILHIGSHKTATTSLQHFCTKNTAALQAEGFYYPSPQNSAYTHNYLAANLVFDRMRDTRDYLDKARLYAEKNNLHSVVLSGESFFAMTCFFLDFYDRKRLHDDYFENELFYINAFKDMVADFTEVKIIAYLRPQDSFAGSLYNQLVKATNGTTLRYQDCLDKIKNCFNYKGHMDLWAKAFGQKNVQVFNFDTCKSDILRHFCDNALNSKCYKHATNKEFLANTRLNRDVLEAKRIFNYVTPDPALAYVSMRVFKALDNNYPDEKGWQIFTPLSFQVNFFSQFDTGNKQMAKAYQHFEIATLKVKEEPTYTGLTDERRDQILEEARQGILSLTHRTEIGLRRSIHLLLKLAPITSTPVKHLRKLVYNLRLRFKGW
ncbi:MAG: hypothetical protein CMH25_03410 [Micavibrio sp.]|nr:hypothetical protein [Micavibrio sp.]|tara:strand:+ start:671072 stop:672205 length:1134 start_codon:yes stop_codon:yes gene_type:complete